MKSQNKTGFFGSCLGAKSEESHTVCDRFDIEPSGKSVKNVACRESFSFIPQRTNSATAQGNLYSTACKVIKSCTHLRRKPSPPQSLHDAVAEIIPIHPSPADAQPAATTHSLLELVQGTIARQQTTEAELAELRAENAALRSENTAIKANLDAANHALDEQQVLVKQAARQMGHLKRYKDEAALARKAVAIQARRHRIEAGCAEFYLQCRASQDCRHQRALERTRMSTAVAVRKVLDLERQLAELRPEGSTSGAAAAAPCSAAVADGGLRCLDARTGLLCRHEEADMRIRRPGWQAKKRPASRRAGGLRAVVGAQAAAVAAATSRAPDVQQPAKPRGWGRQAGRPLSVVWEEQAEGVEGEQAGSGVSAVRPAGERAPAVKAGPAKPEVSVTYVVAAAGPGLGAVTLAGGQCAPATAAAAPKAFCSGAGHSAFQDIAFLPFD